MASSIAALRAHLAVHRELQSVEPELDLPGQHLLDAGHNRRLHASRCQQTPIRPHDPPDQHAPESATALGMELEQQASRSGRQAGIWTPGSQGQRRQLPWQPPGCCQVQAGEVEAPGIVLRANLGINTATEFSESRERGDSREVQFTTKREEERYFKKLEEEAAIESQKRWGTRNQLVVFFGNAGIGTRGGWGAKAVLQACRMVVERANSGKPTDRVPGKVVTVDEFRTSRVSSILNSPQPCEEELDSSKPTRLEGWRKQLHQATPKDLGKWVDRDCNATLNLQRAGESKWRPLELCRWQQRARLPAKGKEYPALGFKKLRDRAPKAQTQQPVAQ
ncbi:hypothetical protein QJQ45_005733 [Haematococcus lacustris]|nr:hypothetical protein QJQ45_005733 [Haematococcus lacustris]